MDLGSRGELVLSADHAANLATLSGFFLVIVRRSCFLFVLRESHGRGARG
jgi:hypothetical protein